MSKTAKIFKREFFSYFSTPVALVFLIVFLVLSGFFTFQFGRFFEQGQADLKAFFMWHPWLYLFIVPAVSMRLWSEERRTGTIELLLTLPVKLWEAVLGKFLAAWAFICLGLLLTFPLVLTVSYLGEPDFGVIVSSYVGSALLAGSFLAIGMAVSAGTNNQIISFVISSVVCLFLILIGFEPVLQIMGHILPFGLADSLAQLSFPQHFDAIQLGVLEFKDVFYFLSIIGGGVLASSILINRLRLD